MNSPSREGEYSHCTVALNFVIFFLYPGKYVYYILNKACHAAFFALKTSFVGSQELTPLVVLEIPSKCTLHTFRAFINSSLECKRQRESKLKMPLKKLATDLYGPQSRVDRAVRFQLLQKAVRSVDATVNKTFGRK